MTKRFRFRNREKIPEHLRTAKKFSETNLYLNELISWVSGKIEIWKSVMGDSSSGREDDKKVFGSNSTFTKDNTFKKSNHKIKNSSENENDNETEAKMIAANRKCIFL